MFVTATAIRNGFAKVFGDERGDDFFQSPVGIVIRQFGAFGDRLHCPVRNSDKGNVARL